MISSAEKNTNSISVIPLLFLVEKSFVKLDNPFSENFDMDSQFEIDKLYWEV